MRVSRKKKKFVPRKRYHTNEHIPYATILVIDEKGQNLGIMATAEAVRMADEREMDLIVINPKNDPPVAKILDFGQFKYQKEKEERKARAQSKTTEVKGIRLTPRIGEHDKNVRKAQAQKFLDRGDKVQIEVIMRGRDKAHQDLIRQMIQDFINDINAEVPIRTEQPITRQEFKYIALIAKK